MEQKTLMQRLNWKMPSNWLWKFIRGILLVWALTINYTAGFMVTIILRWEIAYLLAIAFIASVLAGVLSRSTIASIVYACFAIPLSAALSIVLIQAPLWQYSIASDVTIETVLRPTIFLMFTSIIGLVFGSFIGE